MRSEREELNEALKLNPNLLPARLWLVQSLLVGQEYEATLSVLNQTPAQEKQSLAVTIERNWALLFLGRDKEVRPVLDQALRYGASPELVLQDGILKMRAGDYAGARVAGEKVLKQDPDNARAAHLVLDSYMAQKQGDKAGAWLTGMVAARPQSAPLQFLLGQWLGSLHRNADARKAFEAALAANPTLPGVGLALATLDLEENQLDGARKRLREMLNADEKNVKALLMLASVEDAAGQPAAAIPYYRQVLAVDANNIFALNNLANHLTSTNPEEALKLAQQAVEVAPDNPAVQDTLGWIYYRKGMYGMAVEHLKVAATKEANPRRDFHLGMAYLKSGDPSRGQKMVTTALQTDPESGQGTRLVGNHELVAGISHRGCPGSRSWRRAAGPPAFDLGPKGFRLVSGGARFVFRPSAGRALQCDLVIPPAVTVSLSNIQLGSAAASAEKALSCAAGKGSGPRVRYTCIIAGGHKSIPNGPVLVVYYAPQKLAGGPPVRIVIEKALGVAADGTAMPAPDTEAVLSMR